MRLTLLFCLLAPAFSYSQIFSTDVISANGEHTTSGSVSLTWTLGEVAITEYSHSSGSLGEGFHQCFSCGAVSINELYTNLDINSYPNPFLESIMIEIPENEETLDVVVVDAIGNIVWSGYYVGNSPTEINLSDLSSGMYFLTISSSSGTLSTTKIQKQ